MSTLNLADYPAAFVGDINLILPLELPSSAVDSPPVLYVCLDIYQYHAVFVVNLLAVNRFIYCFLLIRVIIRLQLFCMNYTINLEPFRPRYLSNDLKYITRV